MNAANEHVTAVKTTRLSAVGLVAIHAVALMVLYFVPVFICPTVIEHYKLIGVPETPLFLRAHIISDYFSAYTPILLASAAIYLFILYRRKRSSSQWLPAVSNIVLLCISLFGMTYTAWMIEPMALFVPNAPVAADAKSDLGIETRIAQADESPTVAPYIASHGFLNG